MILKLPHNNKSLMSRTGLVILCLLPLVAWAANDAPHQLNWLQMAMELFGGLALFLFGMEQMSDALKAAAGDQMKTLLSKLTRNRFSAAFTGASTITGNPPLLPQRRKLTSPSAPRVADPVDGPNRWTSTITMGISLPTAKEICSLYRLIPGPEVAVNTFNPLMDAPRQAPMDAISSSA